MTANVSSWRISQDYGKASEGGFLGHRGNGDIALDDDYMEEDAQRRMLNSSWDVGTVIYWSTSKAFGYEWEDCRVSMTGGFFSTPSWKLVHLNWVTQYISSNLRGMKIQVFEADTKSPTILPLFGE